MKIFKLSERTDCVRACCANEDIQFPPTLDGGSRKNYWEPFQVYIAPAKEKELATPPDFTFGIIPILSARAIIGLRPVLEKYGELLPINCPDGTYMVFNVTTVLEILDQAKSQGDRFASGRFMRIEKFVFKDTGFHGEEIFRIKGYERGSQFCTENFVRRVENLGLTGFDFDYVGDIIAPEG